MSTPPPVVIPCDDDGVPFGYPMRPLLDRALPKSRPHEWTPDLVAFAFAEPDLFAVEAALARGWCTEAEADRWATIGLLVFPWHIWPDWLERGMSELDRAYPLEEWWRPAWEWAEDLRSATPYQDTDNEAAA